MIKEFSPMKTKKKSNLYCRQHSTKKTLTIIGKLKEKGKKKEKI